jgi:hypothetical protein
VLHRADFRHVDSAGQDVPRNFTVAVSSTPSATGGTVQLTSDANAAITNVANTTASAAAIPPPSAFAFPFGVTNFRVTLPAGATSTIVRITLPNEPPAGSKYYKLGNDDVWFEFGGASISGRTVTLTLTDNGREDRNPTVGVIDDPGAVAVPRLSTSLLSPVRTDVVNVVKSGSTVPIKWGDVDIDGRTIPFRSLVIQSAPCPSAAAEADLTSLAITDPTGLQFNAGYTQYNWKTSGAAGTCKQVTVTTGASEPYTVRTALFELR